MPSGSVGCMAATSACTRLATSSGFADGVVVTPMKVPSRPENITFTSVDSGPSSTVATSRRRTISSPFARSGNWPNASGVCSVVCESRR